MSQLDHTSDELFMNSALTLAADLGGLASPNPQVGCVLVRDGQVIAAGAHDYDQRDHAEIAALNFAALVGADVRGATAYVTLEPCSHMGRTGPCADALIRAGIARCVVATADPNPLVSGAGIERLRKAGIQVDVGLFEQRARSLNNAFAWSITRWRPFVTLKAALSVDGRLAPPPASRSATQPFWLTGPKARAEVHRLRHRADAILTGIGTVLADDPLLTDRSGSVRRRPLMRVVLDTSLATPLSGKLVQNAMQNHVQNRLQDRLQDLWIFCGADALPERRAALEARGVRVTAVASDAGLDLLAVLDHLYRAQCNSVLLEAGSAVNGAFLRQDLVEEAVLFYAETELGSDALPLASNGPGPFELEQRMLSVARRTFGSDVCVSGLLHEPWPAAFSIS